MNDKISMQSVRTLVRLEMRARFGSRVDTTAKDKAGKALGIIFTLAIYAILVTGIYFLAAMFVRRSDMPFEFLVVAMTFTVCVTTVVAIGNVVKNLYLSGDNELLLRFPVNGKEILLAKSIYCFIHNVVINLLIMIPVCAIYGAVSSAPVGFYFVAIAVMIVAIPLPYAIANLLAIPVMMLMNLVKNQFLLVLILLIAAICGVFILYMTALSGVLEYMRDEGEGMFSPEVMSIFRNFADGAYPFRWYAMLLGGWFSGYSAKDAGLAFLYIFLITAAISVAAYFVTTRTYYKIILIGIETEKVSFQKKIPNIRRSVFGTLLHREFFLILRSFNYSFQYLAMAVAAPVMVYYCNDLAATMGKNTVGAAIVPGLTLLVIIIFSAIIVSFASTSISREGSAFYHTKIVPVSYTTQILAKLAQYELTLLDWVEEHKGYRKYVAIAGKCWPAFQTQFGFVPCYVNSRLTGRGIPVSCEVDIYGALSEFIGTCVSQDAVTLLDINNTVPADIYNEDIAGKFPYTQKDTFMGFHCGNTCSGKLTSCSMKYQLIMARSLPEEVTQGTLEGDIVPGDITFFRLQSTADCKLRAYVAQGEVLPVATRSFGAIGIFAIPEMGRFYRHVLVEKNYPHHGAVAFGHYGKALYEVFKYLGVEPEEIGFNQPKGMRYPTENPFA